MQIRFSYQNTNTACRADLESYVDQEKLKSLTRLLRHGNLDLADLDIKVEYQPHHNNFLMRMNLKIKKHVLVSEVAGYGITEAFDVALEKIIVQLRKLESIKHSKVIHEIRYKNKI